jgi:hypothetical protein
MLARRFSLAAFLVALAPLAAQERNCVPLKNTGRLGEACLSLPVSITASCGSGPVWVSLGFGTIVPETRTLLWSGPRAPRTSRLCKAKDRRGNRTIAKKTKSIASLKRASPSASELRLDAGTGVPNRAQDEEFLRRPENGFTTVSNFDLVQSKKLRVQRKRWAKPGRWFSPVLTNFSLTN